MKIFRCECGAQVFFDNSECLSCGRGLGFDPEHVQMLALTESESIATEHGSYVKCGNYLHAGVCNWLVPAERGTPLCQACELNHVIPDLSKPENRERWLEVEKAKRRLIYGLNSLGLPVQSKQADPARGLSFDIVESVGGTRVLTGHNDGLITLNLDEADSAERERMRTAMKERYRTLLGHFRHEVGHYFWDRLIAEGSKLQEFRALFGDERADYTEALRAHYAGPPQADYAEHFISHYAAAHPWEDFAETFAHYLHMTDTLETAGQFGFAAHAGVSEFEPVINEWYRLSVALNSLNRSMGLPDPYPFAISLVVKDKLRFVHDVVQDQARRTEPPPASRSSNVRLLASPPA